MAKKFRLLCSPFQIKQMRLRNRMVKTGSAMNMSTEDGFITDADLGFYEAIAKGGAGLIIVPHGFVDFPRGVSGPRRVAVSDDKYIPGLAKLAAIMHRHGACCIQQLGHSGPQQTYFLEPGQTAVASSFVESSKARPLTVDEIKDLVAKWAKAAERARQAGFDGVEINSSARYLLNSFMSRSINQRTDEYGPQSLENRARFSLEVLRAVRQAVGNDFPIGVRVNVIELGMENATTIDESKAFAAMFAANGADYINTQFRGLGDYQLLTYPEQIRYPEPRVAFARTLKHNRFTIPLVAEIKKVVNIPVIVVGRMDAEIGEWALEQGKADLVGFTRRLFADPEYPSKVCAGKLDDIAPCTACLHCWATQQSGGQIRCRMNPALGREYELRLKPAQTVKKVMVIGGGPAGMEAARVAALRGHKVTLYDKSRKLGGLMPLAAMIKGTDIEDLPGLIAYYKSALKKLGVDIKLGVEVDAELVNKAKPDAVIIAAGSLLTKPAVPGIEQRLVLSNTSLHRNAKQVLRFVGPEFLGTVTKTYLPFGKKVLVIGGLMQGLELAEFLVKRGRVVTVLEESDSLGAGMHDFNRNRLIPWLSEKGVTLLTGVKFEEIQPKGITVIQNGARLFFPADNIIIATPPAPNLDLFNQIKKQGKETYVLGDAKEPRNILDAISDGYNIGRTI